MYVTLTFEDDRGLGTVGLEIKDQNDLIRIVDAAYPEWLKGNDHDSVSASGAVGKHGKGTHWGVNDWDDVYLLKVEGKTWCLTDRDETTIRRWVP
jgi:hypothetical protein